MKALKIILLILVVLVGGFFIWMATIPANYNVERETVVESDPEAVYGYVSNLETWPEWSSWFQMDPDAKITYGDIKAGEGATYAWESEAMGNGEQVITAAVPNESMETKVKFEGMGEANGYWQFEPTEDGKTKVVWGFGGELPLYARFMKYGIEKQTAPDFEQGLAKIKEKVESMPKEAPEVEITTVEVESVPYFGISHDIAWEEMSPEFFEENYKEIEAYAGEENIAGPAFAIFHTWDEVNKRTVMEPGMPVTSEKEGNDRIKKGITYSGKALKAVHTGNFDTEAEHMAISKYLEENNMEPTGPVWEVYLTDSENEADSTKWSAEIYYPIGTDDEASEE